jgi:pSer/pThr/pTyr-binding forkhead associated (FHA) protein
MPVISVNDKEHSLRPGNTRVGAGPGVDVAISNDAALGLQAVLELGSDNAVVIRRARDGAEVRVNGVNLGVEPTPLIHGDKVEIGGVEITYSDDKKVGATQFVSKSDIAAAQAKRAGPARATTATGGRIVSLVDGKEYQIGAEGVTFGREAGSDVVVAQPEVSRRHASIAPSTEGYVLKDHSTNGIWVNGTRVQGSQLLARADVVRVGTEEFRFYADVAAARPTPGTPGAAVPPQASTPASPPPARPAAPVQAAAPQAAPARPAPPPPAPRAAEPRTSPKPAAQPKPRKEAASARKPAKKSGLPALVWVIILLIVAALAYYLGRGV